VRVNRRRGDVLVAEKRLDDAGVDPASFMSSIMRARNGDIVCSFVIEDGTIPPRDADDSFTDDPQAMPRPPRGEAVPFNSFLQRRDTPAGARSSSTISRASPMEQAHKEA
jgi:hypothetical protein